MLLWLQRRSSGSSHSGKGNESVIFLVSIFEGMFLTLKVKGIDAFLISHSGGMNLDQSLRWVFKCFNLKSHAYTSILSARNSSVICSSCLSNAGRGCLGGGLSLSGCAAGGLLCSVYCGWEAEMCCCDLLSLQLGRQQPNVAVKSLLEER